MRRIMYLFIFVAVLSAQDFEIKSLRVYGQNDELSFPIDQITIEFDIESSYQPNLKIEFKFCDKDWNPYDNVFLENRGFNTEYNLWYDVLPASVSGARYHYKGDFPTEDVTFPFSGKWKFFLVDNFDNNIVYATGRFYVVKPQIPLEAGIRRNKLEGETTDPASFGRVFNFSVGFSLNDTLNPQFIDHVEIIDNRKLEYPIVIKRDRYGVHRFYEWNGSNRFSFYARDVFPSNEYRQTDIRDRNRFPGPGTNAQIDRIEVRRVFKMRSGDINGASILLPFTDDWSDYLNVSFQLRIEDYFGRDVFLVGAFNDWTLDPEYKMDLNNGLYVKEIELKRGIYDYQYVAGILEGEEIIGADWIELEGNFWDTEKEYHIFLYYKQPESGGYDQIIGYKKIVSGNL